MDPRDSGPTTASRGLTPTVPPHSSSPQSSEVRSSSSSAAPFILLKSTAGSSLARAGAVGMLSPRAPRPDSVPATVGLSAAAGGGAQKTQLTRVYIPAQQIRAVSSISSGTPTTVQPLRIVGSSSSSPLTGATGIATSTSASISASSAVTVSPRTVQMRMLASSIGGSPTTTSVVKHVAVTQGRRGLQSPRKIIPTEIARGTSSPHRIILKPSSALPNTFVRVVSGVGGGGGALPSTGGSNPPSTAISLPPLVRDMRKAGSPSLHQPGLAPATGPNIGGLRPSPVSVQAPQVGSSGLKVAVAPKLFQRRILPAPHSSSAVDSQPAVAAAAGLLSLSHHSSVEQQLQQQQRHSPVADTLSLSTQTPNFVSSSQSIRPSPTTDPRTEVPNLRQRKACNCTKSQCLKLYCDCFAAGEFCKNCNCTNCYNSLQHEEDRQRAVRQCLDRNPQAFKPKIGKSDNETRKHQKGCHCKKSGCQKNYCECYEAKIFCSSQCKCVGCHNFEASSMKPLSVRSSVVSSLLEDRRSVSRYDSDGLLSRLGGSDDSLLDSYDTSSQLSLGFSSSSASASITARSVANSGSHSDRLLPYGSHSQSERTGASAIASWSSDSSTISTTNSASSIRPPSTASATTALCVPSASSLPATSSSGVIRVTQGVIDASLMCLLAEVARVDSADDVERRVLAEFGRCLTQIIEYGAKKPVPSNASSVSQLPKNTI